MTNTSGLPMDSLVDNRFRTLEKSINDLIASLTAFNPSMSAIQALQMASEDFETTIHNLIEHQTNYSTIDRLRLVSETLDRQIKATVSKLAQTRHDFEAADLRSVAPETRQVSSEELLRFAKNISNFTIPPSGSLAGYHGVGDNMESGESPENLDNRASRRDGIALEALPEAQKAWLDHVNQVLFLPWPKEDVVKTGALAQLQSMEDEGQVPDLTFDREVGHVS